MRDELSINKELLMNHIQNTYGIIVNKMKYVPVGEVAHSYILYANDDTKYFLKIYCPSRLVKKSAGKLYNSHMIAYQLYHKEQIEQITYPIKTNNGEHKSKFRDVELVIWSFIEGKMATEKQRRSKEFLQKLGYLLGRLHNTTDNLELKSSARFSFDLKFRTDLLLSIKEVTACTTSKDKNYNKLQKLIKQNMNTILESLVYLEELSIKLKEKEDIKLVLCHSDPIIHNIIVDKEENLHLVDWDGAILAPFEQDIWFYLNDEHIEALFQSYRENMRLDTINEDIVVFLFYERILADLTDWIHRILFEEITKKQMKNDFKELEEDIWPVLPKMKEIESNLRRNIQLLLQ
ncbi:MAG: phosphotransferase [Candidatus Heimdallarchaeota archaeon]|nr:phosphotransferase [Candidatus Heimdallarchaeota archaeon]